MKNWVVYVVWAILFFSLLTMFSSILHQTISSSQFHIWLSPIMFIFFGCLLGLEKLTTEFRKDGNWSIDFYRLIFLGLPSMFVAFYLPLKMNGYYLFQFAALNYFGFIEISSMLCGYVITSMFYRNLE